MENVISKENVEQIMKKQNYQLVYEAVFKQANWQVGTKADPKKEFGIVSLMLVVPKDDGDYYTKDIDCFLSDKEQMPKTKFKPTDKCHVVFEFNKYNPEAAGRFVKIVE